MGIDCGLTMDEVSLVHDGPTAEGFSIGVYNLISWSLNSFGVQLDDKLTGHPWPFPE